MPRTFSRNLGGWAKAQQQNALANRRRKEEDEYAKRVKDSGLLDKLNPPTDNSQEIASRRMALDEQDMALKAKESRSQRSMDRRAIRLKEKESRDATKLARDKMRNDRFSE